MAIGIIPPHWEFDTPTGMIEPVEKVTYTHDGLDFTIWVWKQYGEVTDGIETATIKIRNTAGGGMDPLDLTTEATGRFIAEAILPLGALWKHRAVWTDSSQDSGNLMMFLAKTGFLNTLYTNAPANREFRVDGSNNWANPSANIYTLGNLRVRVVKGTPALAGTRITVTPDGSNKIQIMIYNRSAFDSYPLNEMGAITSATADEIRQVAGYYKEIHMRVVDSDMGLDTYMAINPSISEPKGLLVKFYRDAANPYHYLFFGIAGANFANQFLFLRSLYTGIKGGQLVSCRRYYYTTKADTTNPRFLTQTFNHYPVIFGTSWTFWTAQRVVQPLTFKFYKTDPAEILLLYFPECRGDFDEANAARDDVTTTKAVLVASNYKIITGLKYTNNVLFDVRGENGNSIDGGHRHLLYGIGGFGDVKYLNGGVWTHVANVDGGYWYSTGQAIWGISPESSIRYFTMMRHWSGWAEAKTDRVSYFGTINGIWACLNKALYDPDNRAADSVSRHGMCVVFQESGSIPSDAEGNTLYNDYTHPVGVAFEDGLVDLDAGVPDTNLDWDVGYDADGDPQIFQVIVIPTVTTGEATDVESTTATGHGNITNNGGEDCDERGCEWGLASGGPYPNSVTESGSFGVGAYTCNLTGLPCNTIIYYRAKAHNSAGWGYGAEQSFLTFWCDCPAYIPCMTLGIRLNWRDNADDEDNYYVERDDGGWHLIATLPANTITYLDTTAVCGIAYLYRVRAGNVFGYSNYVTLDSPIICPCPSLHSIVSLMRILDIT